MPCGGLGAHVNFSSAGKAIAATSVLKKRPRAAAKNTQAHAVRILLPVFLKVFYRNPIAADCRKNRTFVPPSKL